MRPLVALLVGDERPGHYLRAEGIIAAIARLRPLETRRISVRRRPWIPAPTWSLPPLLDTGLAPGRLLQLVYGIDAASLPPAGLVVSSGGATIAACIAAARFLGAPNILYGGLRRYRPTDFSLILTSYGPQATRPRHQFAPLMPVPIDPENFPLPKVKLGPQRPPQKAGLLIGGPAGTFRYRADEWQRLLAFVTDMHAHSGTRWIIANSPRTPADVSDQIASLARTAAGAIDTFLDVRALGAGTLQRLFAQAEAIVCTADSSSMMSEAVWLRRPTVGVAPAESYFSTPEGWYRRQLESKGWASTIPIGELTPDRLLAALAGLTPLSENPLDQLAAIIKDRMPDLFAAP